MTTTVGQRTGSGRTAVRRVLRLVASLVKLVTSVFAAILVIDIVLTVARANPLNGITVFFQDWAVRLSLGIADPQHPTGNLFLPADENLRILLNLGLAAIIWLVIGIVILKLIRVVSP